jgi:hypothetical protein
MVAGSNPAGVTIMPALPADVHDPAMVLLRRDGVMGRE